MRKRVQAWVGNFLVHLGFRLLGVAFDKHDPDPDDEDDEGVDPRVPAVVLSEKAKAMRAEGAMPGRSAVIARPSPPLRGSIADRMRAAKGA